MLKPVGTSDLRPPLRGISWGINILVTASNAKSLHTFTQTPCRDADLGYMCQHTR